MADSALDPQYIDAIKGFEGYAPTAQWDYKQNTNGYGTKALYPGEPIDRETADQRFNDAISGAAAQVNAVAPNAPPGVKAALTSLTFNAGPGWIGAGLGEAVKAGDWQTAQAKFQQYVNAGGTPNPALIARRAKEAQWFGQTDQAPAFNQPPQQVASLPAYSWSPQQQQATPAAPQAAPQPIPQGSAPSTPVSAPVSPQLAPFQWQPMQLPKNTNPRLAALFQSLRG